MESFVIERDTPDTRAIYDAAVTHAQTVFSRCFGASVRQTPPRFAVTLADDGQIVCAAGIRIASDGFFSQCYLDRPIEAVLSAGSGLPVAATDVLEVGALATSSPFPVFPTLRAIFDWGRAHDIDWGLFTATATVRRLIRRSGIQAELLHPARAARVARPSDWGRYYENDPWVCAFHDDAGLPRLAARPVPRKETA